MQTSFVLEVYEVAQRHPALMVLVLSRTEMQMGLRLLYCHLLATYHRQAGQLLAIWRFIFQV